MASVDRGAASRIFVGSPAEEIARLAAESDAGLIVLSLKRGHGLFGARYGSISYRLLCAAVAPVLALPPQHRGRRAGTRESAAAPNRRRLRPVSLAAGSQGPSGARLASSRPQASDG